MIMKWMCWRNKIVAAPGSLCQSPSPWEIPSWSLWRWVLPVFELGINGTRRSFPPHSVMQGPGTVRGAVVSFLSVPRNTPASVDACVLICSRGGAPGEFPVWAFRQILPWTDTLVTDWLWCPCIWFLWVYYFFFRVVNCGKIHIT